MIVTRTKRVTLLSLQETNMLRGLTDTFLGDIFRTGRGITEGETYSLFPQFVLCNLELARFFQDSLKLGIFRYLSKKLLSVCHWSPPFSISSARVKPLVST